MTEQLEDGLLSRPGLTNAYLLIIDGSSSRRYELPPHGVLVVGRSPNAEIRVESAAISRQHAEIIVASGEIRITDLGSHNGTAVNGECVHGSRTLASGDVVTAGNTTLVLQCGPPSISRSVVDRGTLRRRLEEEIERANDYTRPLSVAVVSLGASLDRAAAADKAVAALRLMDILGWDGEEQIVAVLPELCAEAARTTLLELLEAVAPLAPRARCGLAAYPVDGCNAETLLAGARAAVAIAPPSALSLAAETTVRYSVGGRDIVIADPAMVRLFDLIRRLATSDLPVLILGETGVGKENAAAAIHGWSARAAMPFITLNCPAIPEPLVESELFGHEKGAFSDARSTKPGLLEQANGGTVFLDEVGDLPLGVQAKLLRALEAKRITRLGDVRERDVDFRIVAATNHDLEAESRTGRFRQELLFRLGAAVVELPPLRHRPREVPILARLLLANACASKSRPPLELSEAALCKLGAYSFPGNVRELKNAMDYAAAVTAEGGTVEPWDLPDRIGGRGAGTGTVTAAATATSTGTTDGASLPRFRSIAEELRTLERTRMQEALEATAGVQTRAADLLGMPIRTFAFKVRQYGISVEEAKRRS